jgi:proline dehydrogenase
VVKKLEKSGVRTTIDLLGEYVTDRDQIQKELQKRLEVIDRIESDNLDATQSIKLTSLGLGFDNDLAYEMTKRIVQHAASKNIQIQMDMEDSPYTTLTLDIYKRLRAEGLDNVGIVVQACLKRTYKDIQEVAHLKPFIRLTKGIYIEPEEIAYKTYDEVNDNFKKCLNLIVESDMYVGIATHDEPLIDYAERLIKEKNLNEQNYEFQMLLGVRTEKRKQLVNKGHKMRLYVSYGDDWYGYSIRRFKENPNIVGHILKSIFSS